MNKLSANMLKLFPEVLTMSDDVYKHIRVTGTSTSGSDDAVNNAINTVSKTIDEINWFRVIETRGYIQNKAVAYWQVTVEVGFKIKPRE